MKVAGQALLPICRVACDELVGIATELHPRLTDEI